MTTETTTKKTPRPRDFVRLTHATTNSPILVRADLITDAAPNPGGGCFVGTMLDVEDPTLQVAEDFDAVCAAIAETDEVPFSERLPASMLKEATGYSAPPAPPASITFPTAWAPGAGIPPMPKAWSETTERDPAAIQREQEAFVRLARLVYHARNRAITGADLAIVAGLVPNIGAEGQLTPRLVREQAWAVHDTFAKIAANERAPLSDLEALQICRWARPELNLGNVADLSRSDVIDAMRDSPAEPATT